MTSSNISCLLPCGRNNSFKSKEVTARPLDSRLASVGLCRVYHRSVQHSRKFSDMRFIEQDKPSADEVPTAPRPCVADGSRKQGSTQKLGSYAITNRLILSSHISKLARQIIHLQSSV